MFVLGLDLSLRNTGLVLLKKNTAMPRPVVVLRKSIKTKAKDGDDQHAVNQIVNEIVRTIVDRGLSGSNTVAVIENYAMGSRMGKSFTRSEIGGTLKYILSTVFGIDVYLVAPTSLKKFIYAGTASKEEMGAYCAARFGFHDDDDNIVDAYCLTRYYLANRSGQRLTIIFNRAYPAMNTLQVPAKMGSQQALSGTLTKKLRPRNVAIARRIIR